MALPQGFDPATGRFSNVSTPRINSNHNNSYSATATWSYGESPFNTPSPLHGGSIWTRFNRFISRIGNWFDDIIEPVSGWFAIIAMGAIVIGLVIWVFSAENLLWGIFRAVGACIIGYIALIAIGIGTWLMGMLLKIIRFAFWNAWTFLIALALLFIAFWAPALSGMSSLFHSDSSDQEQVYTKATTTYVVTARELNVRSQPTKKSKVLGKLQKGEQIEVIDTTNGFAHIMFNGWDGYVSTKYIEQW